MSGPSGPQLIGGVVLGGGFGGPVTVTQVALPYTLQPGDRGTVLRFTSAGTLTVPSGLGVGYHVGLVQGAAGAVTLAVGGGVSIGNRQSFLTMAGLNAAASLLATADNVFVLAGDLSA